MITINSLNKKFNLTTALANFNYKFEEGKITTIVGPNGSGKTTLMKCILGFLFPDSGDIIIDGNSVLNKTDFKNEIGYMSQKPSFPENLVIEEILTLLKDLRSNITSYDESLINEFEFHTEMNKQFKALSGGNKQKLNAIVTFLFNPKIILMDEPTAGLDPYAASILKKKIIEAKNSGKTILLTSHILDEIEELTDNLIMLSDGQVKFAFSSSEISALKSEDSLSNKLSELFMQRKK